MKIFRKLLNVVMRNVLGTITHVATQNAVAALTFDDGPHPEFTPRLLDILGKHRAQATFFMVGEAAQRYPELVRQVAQAGHAIGNHSWDHPSFPLITGHERRAQIRACAKAIAPYGQRIFRPPYGDQTVASRLDALLLGYRVVTWNVLAEDWLDHDADWMVSMLVNHVRHGSVILFHDSLHHTIENRYADREPTIKAVEMLLERLSTHFSFVTIPELLQCERPQRRNWYQKPAIDFLNKLNGQYGDPRRYSPQG